MLGVITGDLVRSRNQPAEKWLPLLTRILNTKGKTPGQWEIYRGDEFQLEIPAMEAVLTAIQIKAAIRQVRGLDIRLAIGIGEKDYSDAHISRSSGSAFVHSGEQFDLLKKQRVNLAIRTPWNQFDREMNLLFRLALLVMDDWSAVSAQLVSLVAGHQKIPQQELGSQLGIRQSAVSQRSHRAHVEEIMEVENFYRERMEKLIQK